MYLDVDAFMATAQRLSNIRQTEHQLRIKNSINLRAMTGIKAMTFDIGGTLAKGRLNEKRHRSMVVSYLGRAGFEVNHGEYRKATGRALLELRQMRESNLEMKYEDFCAIVLRNIGIGPQGELIRRIKEMYYECFEQKERKGTKGSISRLSESYKLAVISNSMTSLPRRFLEKKGLDEFFDEVVISSEVGYRKPHHAIFESTLDKLGVEAGETVHVGNDLEEDVKGSKDAGMYSVLTDPNELKEGEVGPDLAVRSIGDVPKAIEGFDLANLDEFRKIYGRKCWLCSSDWLSIFKVDFKTEEFGDFVPLCLKCFRKLVKSGRKPELEVKKRRRRKKVRPVYRKAWSKARR